MAEDLKKKEEAITLSSKTTVFSTFKDKHHETGEEMSIHPKLAEHLLELGLVAKTKEDALATLPKEKKKADDPK